MTAESDNDESAAAKVLRLRQERATMSTNDRSLQIVDDRRAPCWHRAPDLVDVILARAKEPWIALRLGGDELVSVRPGGIVTITGGTGSGKSSLSATFLGDHARDIGPAIAMSLELPADELAGRVVGVRCNASWEDVLCGRVVRDDMVRALEPRLAIIERRDASLALLGEVVATLRAEYPGQPILVAVDYVQLMPSDEREIRRRVADAMAQLDALARDHRVVVIALSQVSRASSRAIAKGERIGADTTDAAAEAAEVERWSSVTLAIGRPTAVRDDGTCAVDLSIGKSRMGGGDQVVPMSYCGRSGLWRIAGGARPAAEVRAERAAKHGGARINEAVLTMPALLDKADQPMSRRDVRKALGGNDEAVRDAARLLLVPPAHPGPLDVVEVRHSGGKGQRCKGGLWTRRRAAEAGRQIVSTVTGGAL